MNEKAKAWLKKVGWLGFFFFLAKGLIWLGVFFFAYQGCN